MKLNGKNLTLTLALAMAAISLPAHAEKVSFGLDFQTIIGGTDVQSGDPVASHTVLVVGKDGDSTFVCTGSIIDKDVVLTAAHCLGTDGLARVVVVFRTSIDSQGPVVQVTDRRRMSDFLDRAGNQDTDWHDLALVKLASPIPAGYSVAKVLPSKDMLKTGGTVTLAGYGINTPQSDPNSQDSSGAGTLRKVEQTVINDAYGDTEFLVSLANNKGACHGDSGGPAFVRQGSNLYLIGVASRMTEKDRVANNGDANDFSCSVEMVYTNVLAQMDWIRENMSQLHGGK
jgi:secreted trypsin-like serine protease